MNNQLKYRTMTQKRVNKETKEIKAMMAGDADFLRPLVRSVIQEFLEAEMAAAIGAEKGERVEGRLSYRSGFYPRSLITRVGGVAGGAEKWLTVRQVLMRPSTTKLSAL
jgi:hypothetical protein